MTSIAKNLNGAEIEAISHYLSQPDILNQPFKLSTKISLLKAKNLHLDLCENCHVEKGTSPIEDTPILRGQWKTYLIRQFEAFSKSERTAPKRMKKRFGKFSDEDKKALIEFYISTK